MRASAGASSIQSHIKKRTDPQAARLVLFHDAFKHIVRVVLSLWHDIRTRHPHHAGCASSIHEAVFSIIVLWGAPPPARYHLNPGAENNIAVFSFVLFFDSAMFISRPPSSTTCAHRRVRLPSRFFNRLRCGVWAVGRAGRFSDVRRTCAGLVLVSSYAAQPLPHAAHPSAPSPRSLNLLHASLSTYMRRAQRPRGYILPVGGCMQVSGTYAHGRL